MINRNLKGRWFLIFAVLLMVGASVVVFSGKRQQSQKSQQPQNLQPKEWLTSVPLMLSKVKDLEIINARIVRAGTEAPGVAFEIVNNSNRAVMAVDIMCGEAGMSKDGLADEEHPTVVIEPNGKLKVEMNGELSPGLPIILSSAIFEDGTEEGTETSLKSIHRGRTHERARLKAVKEQKEDKR
jgi:hypothetical protein